MDTKKIFSLHYSTDNSRHSDKPKFRRRMLMCLEDCVHTGWPEETYRNCRKSMGIDIPRKLNETGRGYVYSIEEVFNNSETPISDILDFITIVHDSWAAHLNDQNMEVYIKQQIENFHMEINRIFEEESMNYYLDENGRVRYYPDEEFQKLVRSTLLLLNDKKYRDNLVSFNSVMDELYKHRNKEYPIRSLFSTLEAFSLSLLQDGKYKQLNESSIDKLLDIIKQKTRNDTTFKPYDEEALSNTSNIFLKWVGMNHKYRHGKAEQDNHDVPEALFNYIFSIGISIFRFLLEMDSKYSILSKST